MTTPLEDVAANLSRTIARITVWMAAGFAVAVWGLAQAVVGQSLTVDAPASLQWAADRVTDADWSRLDEALALAGLRLPPNIQVTLIAEEDARAAQTPRWIVGVAIAPRRIVMFPERTASYPYGSLESVVRHEVAHLALSARAGGKDLPRWFHEGVAVAVEGGWGLTDQVRLLGAMVSEPPINEVGRLFGTGEQPDSTQAYLLATALVDDIRRRHGADLPGAVAARVAEGVPFARAFVMETGETVDEATARAWGGYLRWTRRIFVIVNPSSVWIAIVVLAAVAFVAQRRRRARRRRQWNEEEL